MYFVAVGAVCFHVVKQIMIKFGITFGTFDFAVDEKEDYYFLEVNPEGNWLWIENRLHLDVSKTIARMLCTLSN